LERGEEIVIARAGRPVARLVAYRALQAARVPSGWEGHVWIAPDFDQLPPELASAFRGQLPWGSCWIPASCCGGAAGHSSLGRVGDGAVGPDGLSPPMTPEAGRVPVGGGCFTGRAGRRWREPGVDGAARPSPRSACTRSTRDLQPSPGAASTSPGVDRAEFAAMGLPAGLRTDPRFPSPGSGGDRPGEPWAGMRMRVQGHR